jgi:tRNA-2-methylthio-N6-dimethylallyladenosine synthase
VVKAFVKTYGCQANVADSQHLLKFLVGLGCQTVSDESQADIIIINSCAIREKAEQKMFSYLGSISKFKEKNPHMIFGVIGCVASYRKKEIFRRFPHVSFVFSAKQDLDDFKNHIVDSIESIATKKNLYDVHVKSFPETKKLNRSMINIMRGCNNYCSYCIVPFTTGRERSFSMQKILDQIKRDVDSGAKEITLLGQNVNSYKDPETGSRFETLLKKTAEIDGDFWVRFVSPHPKDMTTDVLHVIAEHKNKLCKFIHLPMQSGSNKILQAMNRTYTIEKYLEKVFDVRKILGDKAQPSDAVLTTDIIVGFPGESEQDYLETRKVMDFVRFNMIFSFVYSPRKYTKAAEMVDSCPRQVKLERLKFLQARHREIGTKLNKKLVGKKLRVLVEQSFDGYKGLGRTEGNIKVFLSGENIKENTFEFVEIKSARLCDITGVKLSAL